MYGHEGASRDLTDRMLTRLPARLASIRIEKTATRGQLPDPGLVKPHFVPDIDSSQYPAICITELDTPTGLTGSRGVVSDMQYDVFTYRYPFRIWVYVMGKTYGDTELLLKRYLTAVRESLLENRVLTDTDEASVTIDAATITEAFDVPDETARQVLGVGYVGVVLESTEVINAVLTTGGAAAIEPYTIISSIGALDPATPGPDGEETFGQFPANRG